MPVRRLPRVRLLRSVSAVLGVACLALFGWLLLHLEGQAMWRGLRALGTLLPLLLALELGRGLCELAATRALLGPDFARLPRLRFGRAQLLALCFDVILPAGRAAAESSKAVLYSRDLGWPLAAAVGSALQLAVLAANALWVLLAWALSGAFALPSAIRAGLAIYAVCISALVVGAALFAAAPRLRALCERMPVLHAALARFSEILVGARARLGLCVGAQLASRMLQALQLWAAAEVLGASPSAAQALLTQAVYLVGAALGELVPAQLGTTDAAFVLAAPALGLDPAAALSVTLALHAVQLAVALLAGLGALAASIAEARGSRAPLPGLGQLLRAADPGPPGPRAGLGSEL